MSVRFSTVGNLASVASPLNYRKALPSPFLKWAGGKTRLLSAFTQYFPRWEGRYFEPFLGGGAVFFHLLAPQAVLGDLNNDLINCYITVRDNVESLIEKLKNHPNNSDYYYSLRTQDSTHLDAVDRAARFIYLNKTCFNGLYRVNNQGRFNVPFGRYDSPKICDEANLLAVSSVLKSVTLQCAPFDRVLKQATRGDFVYLDPPYQPISKTSNFTSYTKESFRDADQIKLAKTFKALDKRGCKLMLSNSNCNFIRDLYADFRIETVEAARAINCKGNRRGKVTELLILNY